MVTATGASSAKVYKGFTFGMQAVAEAVAVEPHIEIGPLTDKFNRNRPISWYGVLGWNLYRTKALWVSKSTSSIAS